MIRIALVFIAFMSVMISLPSGPAMGQGLQDRVLLAERQNSDIRVVMYMTPW